jgi:quinoprotein relay system zinc metallohydrolase 2
MIAARLACAIIGLAAGTRAISIATADTAAALPKFTVSQVAAGVFVHLGQPLALDAPGHDDIANIGFIVGNRCVAVIDTGGSVRIGRALRAAVAVHTRQPICYVINTHVHVDHVLGNVVFKDGRARFVGHSALPAALARSRLYFMTQFGGDLDQPPSADQVVPPDRIVADTLELDLGDRPLHLRAWPIAHTDCDLTVLDERTGTLWTGDLLFRERLPAVDGDVAGWLQVDNELARLEVQRVVPGHGPLSTDLAAALQPEQRYLRALLSDVRSELDGGESLQQAIQHAADSERPHWLLWDSTHPRNVTRVYQQLEWQ